MTKTAPSHPQRNQRELAKKPASRRDFLKVCLLGSAAVVAGFSGSSLNFPPASSNTRSIELPPSKNGSEPLVVVISEDKMVAYQGLNEHMIDDNGLLTEFAARLKGSMR